MVEERLVRFRPRAILIVLGIILAGIVLIAVVQAAKGILIWIFVAIFLALALNPGVEWLLAHGVRRRGFAVGITFIGAIVVVSAIAATIIPTLVDQVNDFVEAVPGYFEDLTRGRGPLGFLEREYQITERVQEALEEGGADGSSASRARRSRSRKASSPPYRDRHDRLPDALHAARGADLGRALTRSCPRRQPRWRAVGDEVYRTIGGYVTRNLVISVIAGIVSTAVLLLLDVPYAVALGLLVALLDLIPLAGATIAAIAVTTVAFLDSTTSGIIVLIFFVLYQQLENHVLQPVVYGRTVQLAARRPDRGADRCRARRRRRRARCDPGRGHDPGRPPRHSSIDGAE